MGEHFKVSSSTEWVLGENVVLRLMECLTPTNIFNMFMDNYFTSFRPLTHLGVNNSRVTRAAQMHYHWGQTAAKKERNHFEQRTSSKKAV